MKAPHNMKPNASLSSVILVPLLLVFCMYVLYKADLHYKLQLYKYALFPGSIKGLFGIFVSPLIHDTRSMFHVFENTIALLFFGSLLFYYYKKIAPLVLFFSWLITGIFVWCFATPVYHVGMSGVIYAIAFFLITSSIIRKNRQLTGVNFLIIFLYGSIFWGLLPLVPGISWESHIYGAVTGVLLSLFYRKYIPDNIHYTVPIVDDPNDDAVDAWWKTGVINNEPPTFTYHYKNKNTPEDDTRK